MTHPYASSPALKRRGEDDLPGDDRGGDKEDALSSSSASSISTGRA